MLNQQELVGLYRELRPEWVLSVYLDGGFVDFAQRNLWRRRFELAVSEVRGQLEDADLVDPFDSAVRHIETALDRYDRFLPEPGWVGFATSERLVHGEAIPVPMPDLVRFEQGIRVAPYVRALKQDRTVVGVLVDSRRARLFTYRAGLIREQEDLIAETYLGDLTDTRVSSRAGKRSGVRGETGADVAHRSLEVESERMLKELAAIVVARTGPDGVLVLGGTSEAISGLAHHLPGGLADRMEERHSMSFDMSDSEILAALEDAASEISRRIQQGLSTEVIDRAKGGDRGALGPESVEQAAREGRVDTLLMSRGFINTSPDYADHLIGAVFEHGGEVEEVSMEGPNVLDTEGRGVAARLRYDLEH